MTFVSVIMTVRNGEPYVEAAIASLLGQTDPDFELILVDNGSTDRSVQIARHFQDDRIRIIELGRDIGRTPALNVGVEQARGDYLAIQDADDLSRPQRLAIQRAFLSAHPEIALLTSRYRYIDASGQQLFEPPPPISDVQTTWNLLFINCLAHSSMMVRASLLRAYGGYNPAFSWAQDYELYGQFLRQGAKIAVLPEILADIRWHPQSLSQVVDQPTRREPLQTSVVNVQTWLPTWSTQRLTLALMPLSQKILPTSAPAATDTIVLLAELLPVFVQQRSLNVAAQQTLRQDIAATIWTLVTTADAQHQGAIARAYVWTTLRYFGWGMFRHHLIPHRWLFARLLFGARVANRLLALSRLRQRL